MHGEMRRKVREGHYVKCFDWMISQMTLYDALQHGRHGNPSQRRWWGLKGALRVGRRSEQEQRQKHVRINYR